MATNSAEVIVAVATLVTSVGGAFVLVYNTMRTKRIEAKVDNGAIVQDRIHTAVNGNLAVALAKIDALAGELRSARDEIVALKGTLPPRPP